MYEATYGLTERPFQPIPQTRYYFPGRVVEEARATLERVIDRGEGPGVVIGGAGTGKTMLCRLLAESFRQRFSVVSIGSMALARRRDLYQAMLHEMRLPSRGLDEGQLRLAVTDALTHPEIPTDGILLVVDEAHLMSARLIEELRLLTNLDHQGRPRVRLILAADGYLEERLASPRLESLSQRLAARCYLQPLDRNEVGPYLAHQVMRAGAALEQLFLPDAVAAIAMASDGNPRLINQLADHALVRKVCAAPVAEPLGSADVQEAWADLQQLPAPWNTQETAAQSEPGVIEFGPLDEPDGSSGMAETGQWQSSPADASDCDDESETGEEVPVIVELPRRADRTSKDEPSEEVTEWNASAMMDHWAQQVAEANGDEPDAIPLPPAPAAENPFEQSFQEETEVPLTADPQPTPPVTDRSPAEPVPDELARDATEFVSGHTNWLPLETLWVTPGTIPELPRDDRDMLEVTELEADRHEPGGESGGPHRAQLIEDPITLAAYRQ